MNELSGPLATDLNKKETSASGGGGSSSANSGLHIVFSHTSDLEKIFVSLEPLFPELCLIFEESGLKIQEFKEEPRIMLLIQLDANIQVSDGSGRVLDDIHQLFPIYELGDNRSKWLVRLRTSEFCSILHTASIARKTLDMYVALNSNKARFSVNGTVFELYLIDKNDEEVIIDTNFNNMFHVQSKVLIEKVKHISRVSDSIRFDTKPDDIELHQGTDKGSGISAFVSLKQLNEISQHEKEASSSSKNSSKQQQSLRNSNSTTTNRKRKRGGSNSMEIEVINSKLDTCVAFEIDDSWRAGLSYRFPVKPILQFLKGAVVSPSVSLAFCGTGENVRVPLLMQYYLSYFGYALLLVKQEPSLEDFEPTKSTNIDVSSAMSINDSTTLSTSSENLVQSRAIKPPVSQKPAKRKRRMNNDQMKTNTTSTSSNMVLTKTTQQ